MITEKTALNRKLIGLDKRETDEYIHNIKKAHESKMNDLRNKINRCHAEKERLINELTDLQIERESTVKPKELIDLALDRVQEIALQIIKNTDDEVVKIIDLSKRKLSEYEEKNNFLQQQINTTKTYLDLLLKDMQKVFFQNESSRNDNKNQDDIKSNAKESPTSDIVQNSYTQRDDEASGPDDKINKIDTLTSKLDEQYIEFEADIKMYELNITPFKGPKDGEPEESFWECTGVDDDERHESGMVGFVDDKKLDEAECMVDSTEELQLKEESSISKKRLAAEVVYGNFTEQKPPEQGTKRRSPVLTMQIDEIRQKYLLGKIVGEDLIDNKGNVIAAKKQTITPEIITRAEHEGKLAELVINMMLPDTGE